MGAYNGGTEPLRNSRWSVTNHINNGIDVRIRIDIVSYKVHGLYKANIYIYIS